MLIARFPDTEPFIDRPVARTAVLADEVGLSEGQLRRRFEAAVGYGPKRLGRSCVFNACWS
jgi:transcriptional regulator GlxA family with amidase domain